MHALAVGEWPLPQSQLHTLPVAQRLTEMPLGCPAAASLVDAARQGDLATVQQLLAQPGAADIINCEQLEMRFYRSETALLAAVRGGHGAVVQQLLAAGASPHKFNPLEAAVKLDSADMVAMLLDAGALVTTDEVAEAAHHGRFAVVTLLLDRGADVNSSTVYGFTILMSAARHNNAALVQRLLAAGAHVNQHSSHATTALDYAVGHDNADIVQQLLAAGADVGDGMPLVAAARSGAAASVQLLLAAGADANSAWNGIQVLYWTALRGHSAVVQQLLAAGAEVDWTCPWNGMTALMAAAEHCQESVVELLLAAGAAVNKKDTSGNSALCLASLKGDCSLGIMQRLLQAGADDAGRALELHHYSPTPSEAAFDMLLPAAPACDALRAVARTKAWARLPALLAARLPLTDDDWGSSLIWQCPDLRPTLAMILQRPDWRDHVSEVVRLLPAPHLDFLRTALLCLHRPQPSVSSGKLVHVSLPPDIILCVLIRAL